MNNRPMKNYIIFGFACMVSSATLAQTNNGSWEDPGGIEDAEIVIEKKREISLPLANRQFEKVPPLPVIANPVSFQYTFKQFTYGLAPLQPRVRPLTLAAEPLSKLYGNYVKAGFGNYITPYFQAQLGNKRNPALAWTLQLEHQSSQSGAVDSANSASSRNRVLLSTRSIGKKGTLGASIGYDRHRVHFYGYPEGTDVIRDSIRQIYNRLGVNISLMPNGDNLRTDYSLNGNYHFQIDRFGAQEHIGGIKGNLFLTINDDFKAEVAGGGWLSQRSDLTKQSRYYAQLQPVIVYTNGDLEVKGGINLLFDNDTLSNTNPTYLYPVVMAKYTLADGFVPYTKIWGNVEMVTWHQLTVENPWIGRETQLNNTIVPIEVVVGGKGALGASVYYDAGVSIGTVRNWYYYTLANTEAGRFNVTYDPNNTTRLNVFGELTGSAGKVFRAALRADYYVYRRQNSIGEFDPSLLVWHRPNLKVTTSAQLNLAEKFFFNVNGAVLGGIPIPGQTEPLPVIVDLNLRADYQINKRLGVFANFNNVVNQNWVRYENYPSRGLMFIGGISYAF